MIETIFLVLNWLVLFFGRWKKPWRTKKGDQRLFSSIKEQKAGPFFISWILFHGVLKRANFYVWSPSNWTVLPVFGALLDADEWLSFYQKLFFFSFFSIFVFTCLSLSLFPHLVYLHVPSIKEKHFGELERSSFGKTVFKLDHGLIL